MDTLRFHKTVLYDDGVQIFEARDAIGGNYLGLLVEQDEKNDSYLIVGVPPETLVAFVRGDVDLLHIIQSRPNREWYFCRVDDWTRMNLSIESRGTNIPPEYLPDEGFQLPVSPDAANIDIVKESIARNALTLELKLNPPEANDATRILVDSFSNILSEFSCLIRRSYNKAISRLDKALHQQLALLLRDQAFFDVVALKPGSVRVILEARSPADIYGHNEAERALAKLDELFANRGDMAKTLSTLRENRGRLANSYVRFIKAVHDADSGISLSWATPTSGKPKSRSLQVHEVRSLYNVLKETTDFLTDEVTVEGIVEKFDRTTGAWKIREPNGKMRSGKTSPDSGIFISEITVGRRYRIHCDEVTSDSSSGKSKTELFLRDFPIPLD